MHNNDEHDNPIDSDDNNDDHGLSHDSEYDDELGVPDSLDVTVLPDEGLINLPNSSEKNVQQPEQEKIKNIKKGITFDAVHMPPLKFKNQNRNVFIPDEDIIVKIINNDRSVTTHPVNPNLYTIEFTHGPFTWTVKKRYKHIQYLHNQLKIYRASLHIPFPTKNHRERRNSLKNLENLRENKNKKGALPR